MSDATYTYDRVLQLAGEPDAHGWRFATIELTEDETAVNPASTKRVIYGPVRIRYEIHPSGVTAVIL